MTCILKKDDSKVNSTSNVNVYYKVTSENENTKFYSLVYNNDGDEIVILKDVSKELALVYSKLAIRLLESKSYNIDFFINNKNEFSFEQFLNSLLNYIEHLESYKKPILLPNVIRETPLPDYPWTSPVMEEKSSAKPKIHDGSITS